MEQPQAEGDGAVQAQAGHVDGEYQLFVNRREDETHNLVTIALPRQIL